jgi:hypothetical protein
MKKNLGLVAILVSLALPANAMTEAECDAIWRKADANGDGMLTDAEASRYLAAMRVHERSLPPGNQLTPAAFKEACMANYFQDAKVDPGAPLKGANSFTEGQAKDRIVAAGFTEVSGLAKDGDGIWRGTATRDGQSMKVAVDYKGNVVGTP